MKSTPSFILLLALCLGSVNAFVKHRTAATSTTVFRLTSLNVLPLDGEKNKGNNKKSSNKGSNHYENDIPPLDRQENAESFSPRRLSRLEREEAIGKIFKTGEDLRNARADMASLKENLRWSQAAGDVHRVGELKEAIRDAEEMDPDLVYSRAISAMDKAESIEDVAQRKFVIEQHRNEANMARHCIARFNLEGLWVGNYGNGAQLINVTYADAHTMVATKVTGDKYIPRGENSFTANLSPADEAEPISLSETAASKWGSTKLQRFSGEGFVAQEGFKDEKSVDGQLVMFDDYFSFTWVPMKYTVFFSRPSAKMTLDLLRDQISKEDEIDNMRSHIANCFKKDATVDRANYADSHSEREPFRRILRHGDSLSITEESGKVEAVSKLDFLKLSKLKTWIQGESE